MLSLLLLIQLVVVVYVVVVAACVVVCDFVCVMISGHKSCCFCLPTVEIQ